MKSGVFAVAAAIAGGVEASTGNHGRHAAIHEAMHVERAMNLSTASPEACGCTTSYFNVTGAPTLYFPPAPSTTVLPSTSSSVSPASTKSSPAAIVPTPNPITIATPGVYTIPASTITLTKSTTVCAATSTPISSAGVYTVGGVTTVVTTSTTVVCPYAAITTASGIETSTILMTTYVCPAAGTYTIGPMTTSVPANATALIYPIPASYAPGTYTAPEITTTITETDYVVYCPFTSPAPSSTSVPAPASSTAPVEALTTSAPAPIESTTAVTSPTYVPAPVESSSVEALSTYAPAPVESSTSSVVETPTSSSVVAVSTPSSTSTSSSGSAGVSLGSSGQQWAITYTPYTTEGTCKTKAEVLVDVALIALKGFTTLRVYSTDCSALENIGAACKISNVKMILGVFISSTGISAAAEQVSAIQSWAQWDLVELISIGNEAIFNGYCSASELASFIASSKATFAAAGYTGPCTTTEPLSSWQASTAELCSVVDVVSCNIHPFFNAQTAAADAGSFVTSELAIVDSLCSGKTGIVLETGWPTAGTCNGLACPGVSEQATALASIKSSVGGKSCILSFGNDLWKAPGEFGCEQSWGAINFY